MLNVLWMIGVIGLAAIIIVYTINSKKNAKEEEVIDADDKTFTLDSMTQFVKKRIDEITKINLYDIGLSEEE